MEVDYDSKVAYMLINVFYQLVIGMIYPLLPLFMKSIGISIIVISIVISGISIISFASSIIIGYFYDRIKGKRNGMIMGIMGELILIFLSLFYRLILAFPLLGFTISAMYPMIMVSASEGTEAEKRFGFFWLGGSIGWSIGTGITGIVFKTLGINYIFGISAIFYAIMVYLSLSQYSSKTKVVSGNTPVPISQMITIISFLGIFVLFSIDTIKNLYLPTYYTFDLGVSLPLSTLTLSVEAILEIPSILFFTYLISKKVKNSKVFSLSFMLASLYLLLNYIAFNTISAIIAMSFYCLVWGSFIVSSSIIVANLSQKFRGLGFGIFNSLYPLSGIITPLYMGVMIKTLGYKQSLLYLSLIPLLVGIFYYLIQYENKVK
ncbi:hypothetical protein DJ531_05430 [Sulfolobus sp. A20-N-F6]|nr:hypothetical protein DJ531_05430 [Sulfolobus sp. A20-N-F6]